MKGLFLVWLAVLIASLVGWVMNVVEVAQTWAWPPDGELVLRVVGIFVAPIGVVMGLFF